MIHHRRASALLLLVTLLLNLAPAAPAVAQDEAAAAVYRVGPGDVLRLNVPAAPELDRELTVQADGTVYVPRVGALAVGGLTLPEAEELILQRVKLFHPQVDSAVLSVTQYNALRVFVLGAVNQPGAYTFATPPTIWEVLRAAGGPAASANLRAARLVAIRDGETSSQTVNLSGYLSGEGLPPQRLEAGDTLVVPTIADGVVGVEAGQGVQVFGNVRTPTTVPLAEPTPLLTVLMLAGAPLQDSRLDEIDWVHAGQGDPARRRAQRVDLAAFLREGRVEGNPAVYPGDALYVPQRRPSWFQQNLPLVLGLLTTVSTTILVVENLQD